MDCHEATQALLDAELWELRAEGTSPLAEHLRACAACRPRAERLLAAHAALGGSLAAERPRRAVGARPASGARRLRRVLWVAVPLAAAAALAVLARAPRQPTETGAPTVLASAALPSPIVQAPAGRNVAVFHTDNPNIVVVWLFGPRETP